MPGNINEKSLPPAGPQDQRLATVLNRWGLELPPLQGVSQAQTRFASDMRDTALRLLDAVARRLVGEGHQEVDVQSRFLNIICGPLGDDAKHWLAHHKRANKYGSQLDYWRDVWLGTIQKPLRTAAAPKPKPSEVAPTPKRSIRISITYAGQPCRKCHTPVERREHGPGFVPKKTPYYMMWWFQCPQCKNLYMVGEAKRCVNDLK